MEMLEIIMLVMMLELLIDEDDLSEILFLGLLDICSFLFKEDGIEVVISGR